MIRKPHDDRDKRSHHDTQRSPNASHSHGQPPFTALRTRAIDTALERVRPLLLEGGVRRGLTDVEAEDALQEVLARTVRYLDRFKSARELERWLVVAYRNFVSDELSRLARERRRRAPLCSLPADRDVAEAVMATFVEHAVLAELASLSAVDRAAIEAAMRGQRPTDPVLRRRFNWRLSTARARLRERLEGWLAGAIGTCRWWRSRGDAATWAAPAWYVATTVLALAAAPTGPSTVQRAGVYIAEVKTSNEGSEARQLSPVADRGRPTPASTMHMRRVPIRTPLHKPSPERAAMSPLRVELRPADNAWVEAEAPERTEDDQLLCVRHVPVVGSGCVDPVEDLFARLQ